MMIPRHGFLSPQQPKNRLCSSLFFFQHSYDDNDDEGEGDCDNDDECGDMLICGDNNCRNFGQYYHRKDDCCILGGKIIKKS